MEQEYSFGTGTGTPVDKSDELATVTVCKSSAEWLAAAKKVIAGTATPRGSGLTLHLPREGATLHNTAPKNLLAAFCHDYKSAPACK